MAIFAFFSVDALDGAPGFALYYKDNDNVEFSADRDRSVVRRRKTLFCVERKRVATGELPSGDVFRLKDLDSWQRKFRTIKTVSNNF